MTLKSKMEYAIDLAKRYLKAKNRKEKTKMLDEFCATAKYHRKAGIRKLRSINFHDPPIKKKHEKKFSATADALLIQIWESYGHICGERLHPFLAEGISVLERCGHVCESDTVKKEVLSMSLGTVKRRIADHKERMGKDQFKGLSATKPGSLLKRQIPISTKCWDQTQPGFCEIDLVAHCGGSLSGDFIYTLQCVDIKTTWTERKAVMGKGQTGVFKAIKEIGKTFLPFDLKGLDSDNGSEFINHQLWKYCQENNIAFTRSRPYMSKDNAHIEQKNWPMVRKILGYDRFDTAIQLNLINDLYDNELRLYLNFFQPAMKLKEKVRVGSKYKRKYDTPKTPYQRVLECSDVPEEKKQALREVYAKLDPVKLKKAIEQKVAIIVKSRVSKVPHSS
jgi:hypothetical protein